MNHDHRPGAAGRAGRQSGRTAEGGRRAAPQALDPARTASRLRRAGPTVSSSAVAGRALYTYTPREGVAAFAGRIGRATPWDLVDIERAGVSARLLKDVAAQLGIPAMRFFDIVGIPKATAEKKFAANEAVGGAAGQATLGVVRLLAMTQAILANSTHPAARKMDAAKWLGEWIERPQPALGGRRPAGLLDTPTGFAVVARVLGAMESGAYV